MKESKKSLLIKYVYEYTFDSNSYKLYCNKLNVVKVTKDTVFLENGQRIKISEIYDMYKECQNRFPDTGYGSISYNLYRGARMYTVIEQNEKDLEKLVKSYAIKELKEDVQHLTYKLKSYKDDLKTYKSRIVERTEDIKSTKKDILKIKVLIESLEK